MNEAIQWLIIGLILALEAGRRWIALPVILARIERAERVADQAADEARAAATEAEEATSQGQRPTGETW